METILGLAMMLLAYVGWQYVKYLLEEWGGAFGRWRRGEPLRASDLRAQQYREERERLVELKVEVRRQYERDNALILDKAFRRRFKDLGLHEQIRYEVLSRCDYRCVLCGKQPKRKGGLHLDHIRPLASHPELEFVVHNLQALCASCNLHKHAYDGDDWKEVTLSRKGIAKRRAAAKRAAVKKKEDEQ